MQQAPTISRSSFGRTLGVAGWVLATVAIAEIAGAGFALMDRARHLPPLTIQVPPLDLTAETTQPALPVHSPAPSFGDPFATITSSTPAPKSAAPTPALAARTPLAKPATAPIASASAPVAKPSPAAAPLAAAKPTPAAAPLPRATPVPAATPLPVAMNLPKPTPVEETQVVAPQSRLDGLIAEATALRQKGDMSTAVTRLREAVAMSPKNPQVLTELAGTYEKMNLEDKASEVWRQIYDLGDSAGVYYQLADAKLKAAELSPGATPSSTPANAGTGSEENGFQQGSVLALVNLSTDEKPETSEGYKRFTLKIPVKRRQDAKIDVSGVVIQVFFYDQLGDESVVRTDANVSSHWATLPADWVQDDIEILEVDYTQAPPEPGKIEEGRHYYGYVVCVYYNKELQDQVADPVSLIKSFPPPLTLPEK